MKSYDNHKYNWFELRFEFESLCNILVYFACAIKCYGGAFLFHLFWKPIFTKEQKRKKVDFKPIKLEFYKASFKNLR